MVTLWKAMVRSVLAYAAELWAGEIPNELAKKAEHVQTDFARAVLGLQGQWGVSNVFVRAELGLSKMAARWKKLRLGSWRMLQVAEDIYEDVTRRKASKEHCPTPAPASKKAKGGLRARDPW